jgi:O-acetyl-ADP-ribose deacetylase (regulator of RNase III)
MTIDPVLTSAFVFLALALAIYFWTTTRTGAPHLNRTLIVCWLLFALFASLLLYHFFPTSEASGTLFGLSVTGAVGVFLVVWGLGPKWSMKAEAIDTLQGRIRQLENERAALQQAPARREPVRLTPGRLEFRLSGRKNRTIGLAMGNLSSVKGVDLWVNSENTYMQMARFFEKNISGTIRYLGATKDKAEDVVDDVIGKALAQEMAGKSMVQPGAVIDTTSGELAGSHGVKRILHVAAVRAQAESGFVPVDNLGACVGKVLDRANQQAGCRSILFPLLGAGTGRASVTDIAQALIPAAISWLESSPEAGIEAVYFLTWTDVERDACRQALEASGKVQAV